MLRKTRYLFPEELWNPLATCAVPSFIFADGKPVLTPAEVSLYTIACMDAGEPKSNCAFSRSLTELQTLTGFSNRTVVTDALNGLVTKGFIRPFGERKTESQESQAYELLNPRTAEPLAIQSSDSRNFVGLRSALYHSGLSYFNVPLDVVQGMSKKSSAELVLFLAVARIAGKVEDRDFVTKAAGLRDLSGLSQKTFKKVVVRLNKRWLEIGFTDTDCLNVSVFLIDPDTKKLLVTYEREQKDADQLAAQERTKAQRTLSAEQVFAWAMWFLRNDCPKPASGAEFLFTCPLCRNRKSHKPKLTVNPFKGVYGAFHCYECNYGGGLKKLAGTRCDVWESDKMLAGIKREQPALYVKATAMLKDCGPSGYVRRGEAA